ncbi:hypothetical protein CVIRNUC_008567 [Coccomyxa viridis]|uniref:Uncharacterized protein n=1 Tax=Coccomyxa viridis TaxID=1274662 RepID=A0AAV1IH63_9CHLO|nr:hypothetical protein CVIRNUC_008567 [Coccomyxa viridis]
MTTEDNRAPGKPPVVPDQKTLALINTYIASTTKALNQAAAACERTMHTIDRRLERVSINMSLLEEKVDSAVASHEAAEVAKRTVKPAPAFQAEPCAEEPPSTAASASDGMEEIDTGPVVPGHALTREGPGDNSKMKSVVGPGAVPSQQPSQVGGSRPR